MIYSLALYHFFRALLTLVYIILLLELLYRFVYVGNIAYTTDLFSNSGSGLQPGRDRLILSLPCCVLGYFLRKLFEHRPLPMSRIKAYRLCIRVTRKFEKQPYGRPDPCAIYVPFQGVWLSVYCRDNPHHRLHLPCIYRWQHAWICPLVSLPPVWG